MLRALGTSAAESYPYDESIDEYWAGLTASRRLSERWGIGLTWYGVYRGRRSREELSLLATRRVAPRSTSWG